MSFDSDYKPPLQPPDWVFGPVWTVLYLSMAVSVYLAWNSDAPRSALIVFGIGFALNLLWTGVFNSSQYEISLLMLMGMIVATVFYCIVVYPYNETAGLILIPYVLWLTFASILNVFYLWEA